MFLHSADADTFPIKNIDSLGNIVDNYSRYFNSIFNFCQKKNSFTQNFIIYLVCMWNGDWNGFGIQCKVVHWALSIVLGPFCSGVTTNNILCTKKSKKFSIKNFFYKDDQVWNSSIFFIIFSLLDMLLLLIKNYW